MLNNTAVRLELALNDAGKLEIVGKFCCLGDILNAMDKGCECSWTMRVKCAVIKLRELYLSLPDSSVFCVQSVMLCDRSTFGVRAVVSMI